jgi:hypothetical protein
MGEAVNWHRFLEWCGYTDSYRALKVEMRNARSTLTPTEILRMEPLIRSSTTAFEQKLAKWTL